MDKEFINGVMGKNIMGNMYMIRNAEMVFWLGQMVIFMTVNGEIINNMVSVKLLTKMKSGEFTYGIKGKKWN